MKIAISIDDGARLDLKVAVLLEKYGLQGIFFIPIICELTEQEIIRISEHHEIGGHTVTHPMDLKALPHPELRDELENSKAVLEAMIGKPVNAFCYPRGRFNETVKKAVQEAGYTWARTTKVLCLEEPTDPYEVDTALHFFPGRAEYEGNPDLVRMVSDGLAMASGLPNGYFHLWLHSWEIQEYGLWAELEEAFALIAKYKQLEK